jgi:hypothetical protein
MAQWLTGSRFAVSRWRLDELKMLRGRVGLLFFRPLPPVSQPLASQILITPRHLATSPGKRVKQPPAMLHALQ